MRSINKLVKKIGELHDAEQDGERKINGLHPHMLRHTFGFRLAEETNKDKFELQRRLGHQSEAYVRVYTGFAAGRNRNSEEEAGQMG